MELKGKEVVFLGDSITEGVGADALEHIYHAVLKDLLGIKECVNAGVSGTRIARQKMPTVNEPSFDLDFLMRFDDVDKDADYLFIFGGTNDFGHGDSEFGTADSDDIYTFQGALNVLYTKAKNAFGSDRVVILTPMRRFGMNSSKGDSSRRVPCPPLGEYVKAEIEAAARYGFKVIDLFSVPELDPNDEKYVRYFADGLHPNTEGHRLLAEVLAKKIKEL